MKHDRESFSFSLVSHPVIFGIVAVALLTIAAFVPAIRFPALALAMIVGALVPEAGLISVALAITVLPLMSLSGPVSDIRGDELMMVAVVLGVMVRWALGRDFPQTGLVAPFSALVLLGVMWMVGRGILGPAVPAKEYLFPMAKHTLRFAMFLSVVWLVRAAPVRGGRLRIALVTGVNLGGLLGLAQTLFKPVETFVIALYPSIRGGGTRELWGNRAFGAFDGNPNHLGVAMMLGAIVALAAADRAQDRTERYAWFAASLVPLFALTSSGSRADWIVCVVLLAVLAVRRRPVFQLALAALVTYSVVVPNALRQRLLVLLRIVDNEVVLGTSSAAKIQMFNSPALKGSMKSTDNFYLDTFYNYSVFALAAWLVLLWELGRPMWHGMKRLGEKGGYAFAASLALVVMALLAVQGPYFAAARVVEVFWLIMGLGWGMLPEAEATGAKELFGRAKHAITVRSSKKAA